MAEPPVFAGAVHDTAAVLGDSVTLRPVGAPGTVDGVTDADADDADPVPLALVAATVKVYAVPLVRPVTVVDDVAAPFTVFVAPPGLAVTV
jgi:hypothetical protein